MYLIHGDTHFFFLILCLSVSQLRELLKIDHPDIAELRKVQWWKHRAVGIPHALDDANQETDFFHIMVLEHFRRFNSSVTMNLSIWRQPWNTMPRR